LKNSTPPTLASALERSDHQTAPAKISKATPPRVNPKNHLRSLLWHKEAIRYRRSNEAVDTTSHQPDQEGAIMQAFRPTILAAVLAAVMGGVPAFADSIDSLQRVKVD